MYIFSAQNGRCITSEVKYLVRKDCNTIDLRLLQYNRRDSNVVTETDAYLSVVRGFRVREFPQGEIQGFRGNGITDWQI